MKKKVLTIGDAWFARNVSNEMYPLNIQVISAIAEKNIRNICRRTNIKLALIDHDVYKSSRQKAYNDVALFLKKCGIPFIVISSKKTLSSVWDAKKSGASDFISKPYNKREFVLHANTIIQKHKRVSCIGGGTGLFHILMGLKKSPNINLTSIVSMSDDGGSSGRLRASFGILPPGDVRRSLVALSNAPEIMSELMQYRFQKGEGIKGHTFGNLFLTALSQIRGGLPEAVRMMSDILNVQGIVLPITHTRARLCARFENGKVLKGESKIDLCEGRRFDMKVQDVWHEPEAECPIDVYAAILFSDVVVVGPGDLFTSIVTNLLVRRIPEALARTDAQKIYICNLMTKPGETDSFTVVDHVQEIIKYMKGDFLDQILISNTKLTSRAMSVYAKKKQFPVALGDMARMRGLTNAYPLISDVGHETELVRHDSVKIRYVMEKTLQFRRTKGVNL